MEDPNRDASTKPEDNWATPKMDTPKVGQAIGAPTADASINLLADKWQELKGPAQEKWAKLTEADLARVSGRPAELSAIIQQRYGYAASVAEAEIADLLRAHTEA